MISHIGELQVQTKNCKRSIFVLVNIIALPDISSVLDNQSHVALNNEYTILYTLT